VIVDGADRARVIAFTDSLGVSLAATPPGYEYVPPAPSGVIDSPDLPPLHQVFGGRRNEQDLWELPALTRQSASTSGTLHHGATQVVLERVAFELAEARTGRDSLQIRDWTVMYTAPGTVGPFEARGAVIGTDPHLARCAARVHLVDKGRDDRLIAIGTAVFEVAR
jgi:hypothetical protein